MTPLQQEILSILKDRGGMGLLALFSLIKQACYFTELEKAISELKALKKIAYRWNYGYYFVHEVPINEVSIHEED